MSQRCALFAAAILLVSLLVFDIFRQKGNRS